MNFIKVGSEKGYREMWGCGSLEAGAIPLGGGELS
jgi:hypothetical protein